MTAAKQTPGSDLQTFQVSGPGRDRAITGATSHITPMPVDLYGTVSLDRRALDLDRFHRLLRTISQEQADHLGEILHHSDWVVTADPKVIEARGIHDAACTQCRAGVDRALVELGAKPQEMLVGRLYWAGPAPAESWQPGDPVHPLQPKWLTCACGMKVLWQPELPTVCPECGRTLS